MPLQFHPGNHQHTTLYLCIYYQYVTGAAWDLGMKVLMHFVNLAVYITYCKNTTQAVYINITSTLECAPVWCCLHIAVVHCIQR